MNHNLKVATVDFGLDEIIINYGTPFQEEIGGFHSVETTNEMQPCNRIYYSTVH